MLILVAGKYVGKISAFFNSDFAVISPFICVSYFFEESMKFVDGNSFSTVAHPFHFIYPCFKSGLQIVYKVKHSFPRVFGKIFFYIQFAQRIAEIIIS